MLSFVWARALVQQIRVLGEQASGPKVSNHLAKRLAPFFVNAPVTLALTKVDADRRPLPLQLMTCQPA